MLFTILVFLAALLIEGIGTYMSVVGLATLFAANPVIIVMAIALDVGKVVSVSFLYRNWKKINLLMKTYMTTAALTLILITSAGVFGYLSAQFQKAIQGTSENVVLVQSMEDEKTRLQARKVEIDSQIAAIPPNFVTGRRQAIAAFADEVQRINERLIIIDAELPALKVDTIKKQVEVGPIIYVAEAFETTPEIAVKYIIMVIIFVFDPLAIVLLIAGNFLMFEHKKQKEQKTIDNVSRNAGLSEQPIQGVEIAQPAPELVNEPAAEPTPEPEPEPAAEHVVEMNVVEERSNTPQNVTLTDDTAAADVQSDTREVITRDRLIKYPPTGSALDMISDKSDVFPEHEDRISYLTDIYRKN